MSNIVSQSQIEKKSYGLDTKTCQKPYKFDLEVKAQRMCGIHCLIVIHPFAKYGKPMSNQKKSYWPDTNLHRQTDRPTDRQIPIYPNELHSWGGGGCIITSLMVGAQSIVKHR